MAFKQFSRISMVSAALAVCLAALAALPVLAREAKPAGRETLPTGVYVRGQFTVPIIQQPGNNFGFVSPVMDAVTQFGLAAQYGNIGLLGHNYLAGYRFFNLSPGERVYLFYGDEKIDVYIVTEVLQYQALDPSSPYSDFRDLATGRMLSADDLFRKVYMGDRHITFQTCIEQDGNFSWGRLFVIAEPPVPGD